MRDCARRKRTYRPKETIHFDGDRLRHLCRWHTRPDPITGRVYHACPCGERAPVELKQETAP